MSIMKIMSIKHLFTIKANYIKLQINIFLEMFETVIVGNSCIVNEIVILMRFSSIIMSIICDISINI